MFWKVVKKFGINDFSTDTLVFPNVRCVRNREIGGFYILFSGRFLIMTCFYGIIVFSAINSIFASRLSKKCFLSVLSPFLYRS
jgi:hypothetical protein